MAIGDTAGRARAPEAQPLWERPTFLELLRRPLSPLGLLDRSLTRVFSYYSLPRFSSISGLEHIGRDQDPFILALNHSTRFEAIALPPLLVYYRGGRRVHFLADWNFQMIPGIGLLYRRSGAIVVTRKNARPRFLNALKPLYTHAEPSHRRALAHLKAGRSIGIFPEGTVNRDPERLLRGRLGAARLSLESGVPVVPAGIRVLGNEGAQPRLDLRFGPALTPPKIVGDVQSADVRAWHGVIMTEIARLSGKAWEPLPKEPRNGTP
ncbi:MAG: 1-acyl-sn-glycerol-3-phosphate acyltransferase [Proteobacteria bacterium]|nr:1-acyl-sn-glycerol-3-phosphate acyltransferase [Pseudomonadota bacterium]